MTTSSGSDETMKAAKSSVQPRARTIHSCNFRYAGRLSNENARALTSLHEKFALNVTNSLEVYLGTSIRLKMLSLEQLALQDYISAIAPNTYLLPCALNAVGKSQTPLTILLAEDNRVNQIVATRLLQKRGHTVVLAETGRVALEAVS